MSLVAELPSAAVPNIDVRLPGAYPRGDGELSRLVQALLSLRE